MSKPVRAPTCQRAEYPSKGYCEGQVPFAHQYRWQVQGKPEFDGRTDGVGLKTSQFISNCFAALINRDLDVLQAAADAKTATLGNLAASSLNPTLAACAFRVTHINPKERLWRPVDAWQDVSFAGDRNLSETLRDS